MLYLQGFPKEQKSFARMSGYVEQNDIHSPQTTVCEALQYSAGLRLGPEVGRERTEDFVDEVSCPSKGIGLDGDDVVQRPPAPWLGGQLAEECGLCG